jgi:putative transposase
MAAMSEVGASMFVMTVSGAAGVEAGALSAPVDAVIAEPATGPAVRLYGLSFRLDPTNVQAGLLARAAGARRKAYNEGVVRVRENHEQWAAQRDAGIAPKDRVKPPSGIDLRAAWKTTRPDWHGEVSSWVFDFASREAASAHKNFLAGRTRFPRFAKKGRTRERFTVVGRVAPLAAGTLTLPKIGTLRIASPCPAQAKVRRLIRRGLGRITSVTIARHADGTWWAACKVEQRLRAPQTYAHERTGNPVVGVDRGVKTAGVVADSAGSLVDELAGGRYVRSIARRLKHAQRRVSRRHVRGKAASANERKARARVGLLHEKVGAQRAAALHAFTNRLAREHPVIVVETLTTKNLMANRHLAGAIADQGWGEMARQLTYKSAWRGGTVLVAPRFFPSSKLCSSCGSVKPKLTLAERVYTCATCDLVLDRDVNAGAVLAAWGEHALGACPCVDSRVRYRHPGGRSDEATRHACGGWVSGPTPPGSEPVLPGEAGTSPPPAA